MTEASIVILFRSPRDVRRQLRHPPRLPVRPHHPGVRPPQVNAQLGISIDCAEILKIWKLVDDLLKRPNTKGVLGIHQLTNKIH